MSRLARLVWGILAAWTLLCLAASNASAGPEVDAGMPNGSDDTKALQAKLDKGNIVSLRPGQTYRLTRRLRVRYDGSGIVTRGTPATLLMTKAFNNIDPYTMFSQPCPQAPCPAEPRNSVGIHAENVTDLVLENFRLEKMHIDGTYVSGIWLRGVTRGKLAGLELWGFSLGAIIALDSVHEVAIRGCTIRDSWANTASTLPKYNRFPQLTGIWFDDNRLKDVNGVLIPSTDVVIANNTISKLRFKQGLFEMPRNLFDGMEGRPNTDTVGHQTDAITVGPPAANVTIMANVIDVVGEGIDCMGTKVRIQDNRIANTYDCALKFIHGASNNIAYGNTLGAAGYATICMAGSAMSSVGNTFGNLITKNVITNVGDRTAYCGANVDPGFTVTCPTDVAAFAVDIQSSPLQLRSPYYNVVQGNTITATSNDVRLRHLFRSEARAYYSLFYGNVFNNGTGRVFCTPGTPTCDDGLARNPDGTLANGTEVDPSADRLAVVDVDGNGLDDVFVHWSASGQKRLRRDMNRTVTISQDSIPSDALNRGSSRAPAVSTTGPVRADSRKPPIRSPRAPSMARPTPR